MYLNSVVTPHVQRKWDKVIGIGDHLYSYVSSYVLDTKKIASYFSDRLTFSNVRGRTSHQNDRLAVPPRAPEKLSSPSKSRIFLYNAHLALFVRKMPQLNSSVSIII